MNRWSANPLGLGLIIVGAVAMAVAVFLPLVESRGEFAWVAENTLIQGGGWWLFALALGIAASGYWASLGKRGFIRWVSIILCVWAAVEIVVIATDKDFRTLYPILPDGTPDTSQPGEAAGLGIALYVAGAGLAAAFIGSLILLRTAQRRVPDDPLVAAWAEEPTKKCPDCAETILADAHVCKHCGYRFPTSNLTCFKCKHVQAVLVGQTEFICEGCGQHLRREHQANPPVDNFVAVPVTGVRLWAGRLSGRYW